MTSKTRRGSEHIRNFHQWTLMNFVLETWKQLLSLSFTHSDQLDLFKIFLIFSFFNITLIG